jgi:hypothetical protein
MLTLVHLVLPTLHLENFHSAFDKVSLPLNQNLQAIRYVINLRF